MVEVGDREGSHRRVPLSDDPPAGHPDRRACAGSEQNSLAGDRRQALENDIIHLVLFKRDDVKCKLPVNGKPDIRTHGKWAVARWSDEEWVFVLMGKEGVDEKRLAGMF